MATKKIYCLLVTLIITLSNTALADGFYVSADLKLGLGKNYTTDTTTVKSRSLINYGVDGNLWYNFMGFLGGVGGEYSIWGQLTKPESVGNSNTQGNLFVMSPMIGYDFAIIRFMARLPGTISGKYTLNKANATGGNVFYEDAKILGLQLHWVTSPIDYWGLEYQSMTFKKINQAGVETTLIAAQQFEMTSFALMYGFYF